MIQHNLSIFNFNRRKWKSVVLVLMFVIFFMTGTKILNYLYWKEDEWSRILYHNFYKQTKNIDYVYLGSSHVYCDLNPEILDEKNGKNNFNMSTPTQRLIESYYCLKEIDQSNEIETVYLELYYNPSTGILGNYEEKSSIQHGWRNIDYRKFSFGKMEALICMNPKQYYMDALFPYVRYREHLMDGEWIKNTVEYKETDEYKKYIYNTETIEYRDKGYRFSTLELENILIARDRKPEEMILTEDAEKYLRKIIEYCQKRELPVILFSSPMYEVQPMSTEKYDDYADHIKKIAAEYNVPYYDFNMAREEYLPIQYPKYFMDGGHLNAKGAEIFTEFFHQIVSADKEENTEYFYHSYQEKLENGTPKVYGIYWYDETEFKKQGDSSSDKTRKMIVAAIQEDQIECQIFLTPEGGNTIMMQDFSFNKKFNISPEEHGICKIIWRIRDDIESMEIQY